LEDTKTRNIVKLDQMHKKGWLNC